MNVEYEYFNIQLPVLELSWTWLLTGIWISSDSALKNCSVNLSLSLSQVCNHVSHHGLVLLLSFVALCVPTDCCTGHQFTLDSDVQLPLAWRDLS